MNIPTQKTFRRLIHLMIILIMILIAIGLASSAQAQGETPYIIRSTKPMDAGLRANLDAWLAVSPPSDAKYYIVTYFKVGGDVTKVSLAGVNLETPESDWSLEDDAATVWLGTVEVDGSGAVSPLSQNQAHRGGGLFNPSNAPGGGSYVAFPFAAGSAALYGPRGVHGSGDYGTNGLLFVDLVGGDDMGATSMPPYVYAADAGTVDYVCEDDIQIAVRTHNESTDDYFLYAHMLPNENLVLDAEFTRGELLGSLKYGNFDDDCGWAEQHSSHYHLHWGFEPGAGQMQVGSCVLTVSSQIWQCADKTIKAGGFLTGGGGFTTGGDDGSGSSGAGSAVTDPTFWDYILTGILSIIDRGIIKLLPEHSPFQFTYMLFNVIEIVFRLAWVLVESNINLGPLMACILAGITLKVAFFIAWLVSFGFKFVKTLVPLL